jgi:hypothetical protein
MSPLLQNEFLARLKREKMAYPIVEFSSTPLELILSDLRKKIAVPSRKQDGDQPHGCSAKAWKRLSGAQPCGNLVLREPCSSERRGTVINSAPPAERQWTTNSGLG